MAQTPATDDVAAALIAIADLLELGDGLTAQNLCARVLLKLQTVVAQRDGALEDAREARALNEAQREQLAVLERRFTHDVQAIANLERERDTARGERDAHAAQFTGVRETLEALRTENTGLAELAEVLRQENARLKGSGS